MKKPIIMLINPPCKPGWEYHETRSSPLPLGILYVGTFLKRNGYEVKIIDAAVEKDYLLKIRSYIDSGRVLYVGLSVMTAQIRPALEISKFIKTVAPYVKIVWGGIHPTLFPEQTLKNEFIDVVVIGEGHWTAVDLARALSGQGLSLWTVKGIAYKNEKGEIDFTEVRAIEEIEQDVNVDFDIIDVDRYIVKDTSDVGGKDLPGGAIKRALPVIGGFGCNYKCSFCINAILGKRHRMRQADRIIRDIEFLMKRYSASLFYIIDEDFFLDRKRINTFVEMLEEKKLPIYWQASTRANYFNDQYINEEFLLRLRNTGFFHTGFGAESGSPRILKKINKCISKSQVEYAAQISRKANVNFLFSFMCALPGETVEEVLDTVRFCYRLIKINPKNYIVGPQVFRPYPGSPLYDEAVNMGLKVPATLEEWGKVYNDVEGYFKLESLPWVKNPEKIRTYLFYIHFVFQKVKPLKLWKRLFFPFLKILSVIRFEINFFGIPLEYKVFKAVLKKEL